MQAVALVHVVRRFRCGRRRPTSTEIRTTAIEIAAEGRGVNEVGVVPVVRWGEVAYRVVSDLVVSGPVVSDPVVSGHMQISAGVEVAAGEVDVVMCARRFCCCSRTVRCTGTN